MIIEKAFQIAHSLNHAPSEETCDRCEQGCPHIFGWAGVEELCMACFIDANLHFDEGGAFANDIKQAITLNDLVALCELYSL